MSFDWNDRARAILNRDWDPIGHCPEDEYDDYRNQLAALIEAGVTDDGLLTYLEWAEVAFIGLRPPVNRERNVRVVAAIRALGPPPLCGGQSTTG